MTKDHIIPTIFLLKRFSSVQGFYKHQSEFPLDLDGWIQVRTDAFLMCPSFVVYFSSGTVLLDIGLTVVMLELKLGRIVIPAILVETLSSLSHCQLS